MDKFLRFSIIFLGTYLILSLFLAPNEENNPIQKDDITINIIDENPVVGSLVEIQVANNTNEKFSLGGETPPKKVQIEKYENGKWNVLHIADTPEETILNPKSSKIFSFPEDNTEFFTENSKFRVKITNGEGEEKQEFFTNFTVEPAGFWRSLWRGFVWKPVYNGLIFLLNISGKDLGISIIILTLIIKFLLFFPTQNAMKSQRKMQKLQPELQKLRSKHAGNQQKIAMESMNLWKKHDVNPMSALLPILLQFPFLIALFHVVQDGLFAHNDYFLYAIQDFDFEGIQTVFLGFMHLLSSPWQDKTLLWLPVVVGATQYVAMKLSFARMAEQKKKQKPAPKAEGFMADFQNEFQKMNKVFVYVLPVMIALFTITMPTAVGLYWFISTLFSIWQQKMVNKEIG